MVHTLLVLAAAEQSETSKVAFYVAGGLLAAWAVILSFVGLRDPEFPGSVAATRGVMTVSVVLVLAAVTTAVVTA